MAPTTAFKGRNISEDSLRVSMATLTAAYAVCQPVSLPRKPAPSPSVSWVSVLENAELIERAIAVDEAASALESPRGSEVRFCTNSVGDVGVVTEISAGLSNLRMRGITKVGDKVHR